MNPVNLNGDNRNGNLLPKPSEKMPSLKGGMALPAVNGRALSTNTNGANTTEASTNGANTTGASTNGTLPESNGPESNGHALSEATPASPKLPSELHRVGEVRVQQGASLRSVSRRMNLTVQEVRDQESSTTDLHITDLLKWQEVLEVPLADLLIDSEGPLSEPVCERARMLRIMKTAKAIHEGAHNRSIIRLANMLIDQLVEIMPELSEVSAWHTVGQRRTQDEVGRIVERSIPDNFFTDSTG